MNTMVRRPEFMYLMRLGPGDLQLLSNFTVLHSRTEFEDYEEPERKRTLFRLWLSPPNAPALPSAWAAFYRATEPGQLRGGIRGQQYDDTCRAFDSAQAVELGLK
jgi:hypothetical protein